MAPLDLTRIYPEGPDTRSVVNHLPHPHTHLRQLAVGFDFDPGHWHNRLIDYRPAEYELLYLLAGQGTFECDGKTMPVGPGSVIQRFPDRPTTLRYTPANRRVRTCYLIVPAVCYELCRLSGALVGAAPVIDHGIDRGIIDCLRDLYRLLRDTRPAQDPRLLGRCVETLMRIHQRLRLARLHDDPDRRLVEEVKNQIAARPERRITVGELAAEAGCSETRLRRLFARHLGCSPGRYGIERRIERACDLLYAGNAIADVSERLGYPDVFTFGKQFKRFTGRSPGTLAMR